MRYGLILVLLVWLGPSPARSANYEDVNLFIGQVLRGIEAKRIECPRRVVEETNSRDMGVVCALFDGDFASFELRWTDYLERETDRIRKTTAGRMPRSEARTAWESRRGAHERIYAVAGAAVGVRFQSGTLTFVFK